MDDLTRLQKVFQTLADENRLKIIRYIGDGEKTVSEITSEMNQSQPLISHHLKTLRTVEILCSKRKGPFVIYMLNDKRLLDLLGSFSDLFRNINDEPEMEQQMFNPPRWWKDTCFNNLQGEK